MVGPSRGASSAARRRTPASGSVTAAPPRSHRARGPGGPDECREGCRTDAWVGIGACIVLEGGSGAAGESRQQAERGSRCGPFDGVVGHERRP